VRGGSGSGGFLNGAGTSRRVNRFRRRPGRARNFGMLGAASALVLAVLAAGHGAEASTSVLALSAGGAGTPHIMVVMDENEEYSDIIGNPSAPYLNSLAAEYTTTTNWYSIEHISGADYRDLVSGYDYQPGSTTTIVDELNKAGIPWKAYMESMPSNCYTGSQTPDYTYDAHHNPLHSFPNYTSYCNDLATEGVVPYAGVASMVSTLDSTNPPDFVWLSPNTCDDMHADGMSGSPCPQLTYGSQALITAGDTWLQNNLGPVIASPWFAEDGTIVITWDEGNTNLGLPGGTAPDDGGHIATLVISSNPANHGKVFTTPGDNFGALRAIQEAFGLPLLGNANDPANGDLSGAFGQSVSLPSPSVTGVRPSDGPEGGGALVTISGSNFKGGGFTASDVLVGSTDIPAGNAYPCPGSTTGCFAVSSSTQISVFTPRATSAGTADVTVVTPGGSSRTTSADEYTSIAPAAYTALIPFRICDTRPPGAGIAANQCNTGSGRTLGTGHETITAQITAAGGPVPAGAQALVANMTAINRSTSGTFVTAFPAGGSAPLASNINLAGEALGTNLVIVQLSASGQISVFNAAGSADVILDVEGYFAAPGGTGAGEFHSIPPLRICDTRAKQGTVCAGATDNPLTATTSAGVWRRVVLSGLPSSAPGGTPSIPVTGAAGAVFNLTATGGTNATLLAVRAPNSADLCPTTPAPFSNVNPAAGGSRPNRVISSLGPNEDVCVFNAVGSINFIIDVDGWFGTATAPAGAFFYSVPPTRICDTRSGSGTSCAGSPLTSKANETIEVAGVQVMPAEGGSTAPIAMVANLTAIAGTASTFFTLYPSDVATPPRASDLNPVAGQVIANLAVVGLATTGAGTVKGNVNLYNAVGDINAILDVCGWFQ
jgi:Phosphoesterase family/IPT/TIG domain